MFGRTRLGLAFIISMTLITGGNALAKSAKEKLQP